MVIIRFQGGIGNQLFQYALYKKLQYLGKEVWADTTIFRDEKEIRSFDLPKLGVNLREASMEMINSFYPIKKDFVSGVLRQTIYRKKCIKEKEPYVFAPIFLNCDDAYLSGYWQTEKYFEDIKEIIRDDISFFSVKTPEVIDCLNRIQESNSISIHVRLGDYVNNSLYDNICTEAYYKKAIQEMNKRIKNTSYFVFSDDVNKAREMLGEKGFEYINYNHGENSYYDMYMISQCKHHIMANSSFSWWGTWLSDFDDKKVICPSVWMKGVDKGDIWMKEWIKITPQGDIV